MAWIRVETPNANYVLMLESHLRQARGPFGELDGVILEGMVPTKGHHHSQSWFKERVKKTYGDLLQSTRGKSLFGGDVSIGAPARLGKIGFWAATMIAATASIKSPHLQSLPPVVFFVLHQWPMVFIPGKEMKLRKKISRTILKLGNLVTEATSIKFRDAVIAEKAERVIAPLLRKRIGRKPVIGVVYGAGHVGIAELLKNRARRRRVLSRTNIQKRGVQDDAARVLELEFDPDTKELWRKTQEPKPIQLPKFKTRRKRMKAHWRLFRQKTKRMMRRTLV